MTPELERLEGQLLRNPRDSALRLRVVHAYERAGLADRALPLLYEALEWGATPDLLAMVRRLARRPLGEGRPQPMPWRGAASFSGVDIEVWALAIDPAERQLAVGLSDGQVLVGPLGDGAGGPAPEGSARRLGTEPGGVTALAFSPDGTRLGTGSSSGRAREWDVERGRILQELGVPDDPVQGVALGGGRLVAGWSRRARLQDRDHARARGATWTGGPVSLAHLAPRRHRAFLEALARRAPEDLQAGRVLLLEGLGEGAAVLEPGRLELLGGVGEPRRVLRSRRFYLPDANLGGEGRGAFACRPVALAAGGRMLALGSRIGMTRGGRGAGTLGASLLLLGEEGEVADFPLLKGYVVTAVAFSPAGNVLALGVGVPSWRRTYRQLAVQVDLVRLRPVPVAAAPRPRRAAPAPSVPEAVAQGEDLREDPRASPPAAQELVLLAAFPPALDRSRWPTRPRVVVEGERVWTVCPSRRATEVRELATGEAARYPYVIEGDGTVWTHPTRGPGARRHAEPVMDDAFPGFPLDEDPGGPPEPARLEATLGIRLRRWVPAPGEALAVFLAVGVARELWVAAPGAPRDHRHLVLPEEPLDLGWSPRGTRLVLLFPSGLLWVVGAPPSAGP